MSKLLRGYGLASAVGSLILWSMSSDAVDPGAYFTYDVLVALSVTYFFAPLLLLAGGVLLVLAKVIDEPGLSQRDSACAQVIDSAGAQTDD